jgi:hypothetical protein
VSARQYYGILEGIIANHAFFPTQMNISGRGHLPLLFFFEGLILLYTAVNLTQVVSNALIHAGLLGDFKSATL